MASLSDEDMIDFQCSCGTPMQVPAGLAGRTGRCPRCDQIVEVPNQEEQLLTADDSGVQEVCASPVSQRRSCRVCGKKLETAAVVCTGCGTNARTGEKLSGGARDLLSIDERLSHRQEEMRMSFWTLVRGALLTPFQTLETISFQLSFPEMTVRMTLLWLSSMLAIGAVGALQDQRAHPTSSWPAPAPSSPRTARTFRTTMAGAAMVITLKPAVPVSGEIYKVDIRYAKGALPGKMTYSLYPKGAAATQRFRAGVRIPTRHPGKPYSGPLTPSASAGVLELLHRDPGGKRTVRTFGVPLRKPHAATIRIAPLAVGMLKHFLWAMGLLVGWTLLLAVGGRIMTGRSQFLSLLLVLGFLTGLTTWVYLPFKLLLPGIGESLYLIIYIIGMWTLLLNFVAVMHVYGLEPRSTGIVVFLAVGAVYVAWFFYSHAGMA